jgi:hypothetical protein
MRIASKRWWHESAATAFVLVQALLFLLAYRRFGIAPESRFLSEAEQWVQHGIPPSTDAYPPLVSWFYALVMTLLSTTTLPLIWVHAAWFALSAVFFWIFLSQLPMAKGDRLCVFVLAYANPYFVWLCFTSKDTAYEASALFLFFAAATRVVRSERLSSWRRSAALVLLPALAAFLVRLPAGLMALAAALLASVLTTRAARKVFVAVTIGLVVTAVGYGTVNRARYGAFGLSYTLGLNVYYGNNALYDYGHPRHDIDVYLPPPVPDTEVFTPAANQRLTKLGLDYMRAHPLETATRITEKSVWWWFNFEKVPNLSSNTALVSFDPPLLTVRTSPIRYLPMVAYLLYKIVYVPLFILALALLLMGRRWRETEWWLLLMPLIAVWPLAVITFPDTRFKIVPEMLLVPWIFVMGREAWRLLRREQR